MLKYKGSDNYHKLRINDDKKNEIEISDDEILQIQNKFSFIINIDPQKINQDNIFYFNFLEQDIDTNKEMYYKILPKILPFTIYHQYISFLEKTQDARIHKLISRIIVILTYGLTVPLQEFSKYNLLKVVENSILQFSKYENSTDSLLQIIANFLDDPDEQVSLSAHELFTIEYLFKILEFIKSNFNKIKKDNLFNSDQAKIEKSIINKWMKCIFATLNRYSSEIQLPQAINIFFELSKYFNIIQEDALLSQCLCQTVKCFLENDLIKFSDFNNQGFPSFINFLSQMEDINVKVNAFIAIGKLISINRFSIAIKFLPFLDIIKNSNPATDPSLLTSTIYVCNSFFENKLYAEEAFKNTNADIECLLQIYDYSNFSIKKEMISIFASYLHYISHYKIDIFPNQITKIIAIVDRIFEFIESADPQPFKYHPFRALFDSINYIYSINQSTNPAMHAFISNVMDHLFYLRNLNNEQIDIVNSFIESVNQLENAKQNQEDT